MTDTNGDEGVIRAAGTVSALTMLSRVLGLGRDIASAMIFGSGMFWDCFVLAFTVPNLFRAIFGEGALTSAFLPTVVSSRKEQGPEHTGRVISAVITLLVLVLTATATVIAVGCLTYLALRGFNFRAHLTATLLLILIFYLPLICGAAALGAALNAVKHFAMPALAPVLLNLLWIAGVLAVVPFVADPFHRILILAAVVLLSGVLQLAVQLPVLRRYGLRVRLTRTVNLPEVGIVLRGMAPVVVALFLMELTVLVDRIMAMTMVPGSGAVSALFYANRLVQLPLAIFGVALGVAVFPAFRELVVDQAYPRLWATLNLGIRLLLLLVLPSAAGLIVLGGPIVDLLFNWRAFAVEPDAAQRTCAALAAYATGLFFFSLGILVTRAFHAMNNRRFPALVAAGMVVVDIGLNILFLKATPLRETGLALTTSITACLNVGVLLWYLNRTHGFNDTRGIGAALVRTAAAVMVMVVAVAVTAGIPLPAVMGLQLPVVTWDPGFMGKLLRVLAGVGAGVAAYAGAHLVLRTPELAQLGRLVRRGGRA
ncbi:MAG: murein biosynthesis integral membrane protein MurJ [Planctomycetota bacterium]